MLVHEFHAAIIRLHTRARIGESPPIDPDISPDAGYEDPVNLKAPFQWLGRRDSEDKAAKQDDALIDTPDHSDVVEDGDDDVLADEGGPRPTPRFRRLQR